MSLSAGLGNVLLHVEISRGGSWWSNSGCRGGNHDESAADLVQDSEPQLAKESQLRVCRELPNGARQRQKPQQEFGQSSHSGKTAQLGSSSVHMPSLGTVPELDEHDETCGGDDEDDHDPKVTKHILTTCWTWPTSQRSLTQRRVGMRWRLGCQTMAVAMT